MNAVQRLHQAIFEGSHRVVIQSVSLNEPYRPKTFELRSVKLIYISQSFYRELVDCINDNPKMWSYLSVTSRDFDRVLYQGIPMYTVYDKGHPDFEIIWN